MKKLARNFFWVTICVSLVLIHILFVLFEVNIYEYLFWPYALVMFGTLILAVIVFSNMEDIMKEFGPNFVLSKHKKVLSSFEFWIVFIFFTLLLYTSIYSLGQLFVPQEYVQKVIFVQKDAFVGWAFVCFPLSIILTIIMTYFMKLVIRGKQITNLF